MYDEAQMPRRVALFLSSAPRRHFPGPEPCGFVQKIEQKNMPTYLPWNNGCLLLNPTGSLSIEKYADFLPGTQRAGELNLVIVARDITILKFLVCASPPPATNKMEGEGKVKFDLSFPLLFLLAT